MSEARTRLFIVAALALAQAVLGTLRALHLVSIGADLSGGGILLLPILGSLMIAKGVFVGTIAALYVVFAWGAFRRKAWAWSIGLVAAVVNELAIVPLLFGEEASRLVLLWAVVPTVIIVYLLAPAGRRALLG